MPDTPNNVDFNTFGADHYVAVAVVAGAIVSDRTIGEEIASEALEKARDRWDLVSTYEMPGAWVRRIAINLAINHQRRHPAQSPRTTTRSHATDNRSGDSSVWAAIDKLAPEQRAMVAMHYLEGHSILYTADVFEKTVSAATSTMNTATADLCKGRVHGSEFDALVTSTLKAEYATVRSRPQSGHRPGRGTQLPTSELKSVSPQRWQLKPIGRVAAGAIVVCAIGLGALGLMRLLSPATNTDSSTEQPVNVETASVETAPVGTNQDAQTSPTLSEAAPTEAPTDLVTDTAPWIPPLPEGLSSTPGGLPPFSPSAQMCVVGIVAPDALNLREGPGVAFDVVVSMPSDSCNIFDTGLSAPDGWRRVYFIDPSGARSGWASGRYLRSVQVDCVAIDPQDGCTPVS